MAESASVFLWDTRNPDGAWGYGSLRAPTSKRRPLSRWPLPRSGWRPGDGRSARGCGSVAAAAQNADGGWGFARDDPQSGWMTAWAVLALARAGETTQAADRGAAWLLRTQALDSAASATAEEVQQSKTLHGMDLTLRAWPWFPDQASFVEPTALALWALAIIPPAPAIQDRADQAVRYLADRRCPPGGWNIGSPMMFSRACRPVPVPPPGRCWRWRRPRRNNPTGGHRRVARRHARRRRRVGAGVGSLRAACARPGRRRGTRTSGGAAAPDGGWGGNPYTTAVALMAGKERA